MSLLTCSACYETGLRDFAESRRQAVDDLRWEGILRDPEIIRAMSKVPRADMKPYAYHNSPLSDASDGLKGLGPFDLIIVTSAAPEVPSGLVDQVKVGGILLIPVGAQFGQELIRVRKNADGGLSRENLGGVALPMKGKRG